MPVEAWNARSKGIDTLATSSDNSLLLYVIAHFQPMSTSDGKFLSE
jgi:hypothetical protein